MAVLLGLSRAQVVNVGDAATAPAAPVVAAEPFDENPGYAYAFEVNDDEEQVYQAHSQTMEDKVIGNNKGILIRSGLKDIKRRFLKIYIMDRRRLDNVLNEYANE